MCKVTDAVVDIVGCFWFLGEEVSTTTHAHYVVWPTSSTLQPQSLSHESSTVLG